MLRRRAVLQLQDAIELIPVAEGTTLVLTSPSGNFHYTEGWGGAWGGSGGRARFSTDGSRITTGGGPEH